MEFLCVYVDYYKDGGLSLPDVFKRRLAYEKPSRMVCKVGELEFSFRVEVADDQEWIISGETWKLYKEYVKMDSSAILHFVIVIGGPIHLIHYIMAGYETLPKYRNGLVNNRPRAIDIVDDHSSECADINPEWFKSLDMEIKAKYSMCARGKYYKVDIRYVNGKPSGFCGAGWRQMYIDFDVGKYNTLVFMHCNKDVFKVTLFDYDGSEVKSLDEHDWEIFTNGKIKFPRKTD